MKYIISENRIKELIKNYLNQKERWVWDIGDGEFNVSFEYHEKPKINYRINPENDREFIYINDELLETINSLFSISNNNVFTISSIIDWFNETFNTSVTMQAWASVNYDDVD